MTLAAEYRQQSRWRPWSLILDQVPLQPGQTILDLGCGIGDQARELASRGCKVIGLDANDELLGEALLDSSANCEFLRCDLRDAQNLRIKADGIWCSFVAAYCTNLAEFLSGWDHLLCPGGWIAMTEIDDLFGHEPLSPQTKLLFQGFAEEALAARRYDFRMGSKLQGYLAQAGFSVSRVLTFPDQELSFEGSAAPDVMVAWRNRFERMPLLRTFCGSEFENVREEFLSCLSRPDHVSTAKVVTCIGTKST